MKKKVQVAIDERMYKRLEKVANASGLTVPKLLSKEVTKAVQDNRDYTKAGSLNSSKGVCNDK